MKQLHILFALIVVLAITACKKDDANGSLLSVDQIELRFSSPQGSMTFNLESNTDWEIISRDYRVTTSPQRGSGNATVTVNLNDDIAIATEEIRLIIHTLDGRKTVNVKVFTKGKMMDEKYLTSPDATMTFDGYVGAVDSLTVGSNINWQLTGPDWLEGSIDGVNWKPLSRTMRSDLTFAKVYLRTTTSNNEDDERSDFIILSEDLTGNMPQTIVVTQVGANAACPNQTVGLVNGAACNWKFGNNVKSVRYSLLWEDIQKAEDVIQRSSSWKQMGKGIITSWRFNSTREGQRAYIYSVGCDANGEPLPTNQNTYKTFFEVPRSEGQALATINSITNTDNKWSWNVTKNELCASYVIWTPTTESYLKDLDAMIAWRLHWLIKRNNYWAGTHTYFDDKSFNVTFTGPFQIITWGYFQSVRSNIISRYINKTGKAQAPSLIKSDDTVPESQAAAMEPIDPREVRIVTR